MAKVSVRFKVDQKTNYGFVMAGEEKLIPEEAAELFVQRGIAQYVLKDTAPCDPDFDKETMEALTKEHDPMMEKAYIEGKVQPLNNETREALKDGMFKKPPTTEKPKRKKRGKIKPFKYTDEN